MPKQPLGITVGEGGTGVYEHEAGIEVLQTDAPYLLTDGVSLAEPLLVHFVDGPVFFDSCGNPQAAIPVRSTAPPVPVNGVTVDGVLVTHQGAIVTHTE